MQYSPKLKKAAEEIKEVLAKYDIAGAVVLHTPGYSEFVLDITPTYSCAWIQGEQFRIRAKKADYDTLEEWKQRIADTANMTHHLSTQVGQLAMNLFHAAELVDKAANADHGDGNGFTSHTTQNN